MLEILFPILCICVFGIPMIIFVYLWKSKYCSCPYCGDEILKSDKICSHCSKPMPKYENLESKIINVSHAYQDGARILATPESKLPEMFEQRKK